MVTESLEMSFESGHVHKLCYQIYIIFKGFKKEILISIFFEGLNYVYVYCR